MNDLTYWMLEFSEVFFLYQIQVSDDIRILCVLPVLILPGTTQQNSVE